MAGLIAPLVFSKNLMRREVPFGILGAVLIYLLAGTNEQILVLDKVDGGILILGFIAFFYLIYRGASKKLALPNLPKRREPIFTATLLFLGGLIGLAIGGNLVVETAKQIAQHFAVSEKLIGLTLVALGTSLPELVTSVVAVWKNKIDLAIGNVIGSNVFNIFWVLGVSAIINPIVFVNSISVDLAVLIGITLFLLFALLVGEKKHQIDRIEASILLVSYCGYIAFIVCRG